jgi:hypothetical protein
MSCKACYNYTLITNACPSKFSMINPGEALPQDIIITDEQIATEQCYAGIKSFNANDSNR